MSGAACARAASDLTTVANRLQRTGRALARQARLPLDDFGGLSGDAYRRHADQSACTVARLASDVALLAGALAALSRALDDAEALRDAGFGARARDIEVRAQESWRDAVARFEGRPPPVPETPATTTAAATSPATAAPAPAPAAAMSAPTRARQTLASSLVAPRRCKSELVTPPRCGTTEAVLDDEA